MFNISESQKKVLTGWIIIGIVILILVSIVAVVTVKEKSGKEDDERLTSNNSKKIIDRSRYYTVKNAITKYYSFVNMKDYDSVLKIFDEEYKKKNNINESNVKEFLTDTVTTLSYDSRIICLKNNDKGVYTFVVDGDEISANTGTIINRKYYEITMDGNNSTFYLYPIDESSYNEVCNG